MYFLSLLYIHMHILYSTYALYTRKWFKCLNAQRRLLFSRQYYAKRQNKSIMVQWYAQEAHRIRETGFSFKHIAICVLELVV